MLHARVAPAVAVLLVCSVLAGCVGPTGTDDADEAGPADAALLAFFDAVAASPELRFETDHGTIRMLLYTELMPQTAGRIGALAASGFYDDTTIHRVVDDFVIQGGDPTGTGTGGSGQNIPHEIHPDLLFGSGALGLARGADPDSGDSQWFITERPAPHLSDPSRSTSGAAFDAFALYGHVFEGMDVVRAIAEVLVVPGLDRPVFPVVLQQASLGPPPTLDLLQFPPTLRIEDDASPRFMVERPLHLFADHPFLVTVQWNKADDATPPDRVGIRYGQGDEAIETELLPLDTDPWVYTGSVVLPAAGTWQETIGNTGAAVQVHPWHDAYAAYVLDAAQTTA